MDNSNPIGVFDSGLGGLSVLNEIHQLLPDENLIYIGDSAYAPYGDNEIDIIRNRCLSISNFLVQQGVKAIVVACNTATAEAIETIRKTIPVPIIGLEPAIKPAVKISQNGIIGILATQRTIDSGRLSHLTKQYVGADSRVIKQACPGLAEQVEQGELNSDDTKELLIQYLDPLLAQNIDTLILGCTHYPFLIKTIKSIINERLKDKEINIIETSKPVALQLQRVLAHHKLENKLACSNSKAKLEFYNSSKEPVVLENMKKLWNLLNCLDDHANVDVINMPIAIKALPKIEYKDD